TPLSAISRFNWSPESTEARPLLKASGEDGSSFRADLEQSIQIKPVYEIRNAQNRAAVPDGVVCCSHWTKVPYADTVKPAKINLPTRKQKNHVMTKSTPTLTQSGLLAVLLQRQHYKVIQLARRRVQRKHARAVLWSNLTWLLARAHRAIASRRFRRAFAGIVPRRT